MDDYRQYESFLKEVGLIVLNLAGGLNVAIPDDSVVLNPERRLVATDAYAVWISDPDSVAGWEDACAGKALSPVMAFYSHRPDLMVSTQGARFFLDEEDYLDYAFEMMRLMKSAYECARDDHGMQARSFRMTVMSISRLTADGASPCTVMPAVESEAFARLVKDIH